MKMRALILLMASISEAIKDRCIDSTGAYLVLLWAPMIYNLIVITARCSVEDKLRLLLSCRRGE